jgi:glycosyltransferase involved in cell wall biosynthesis
VRILLVAGHAAGGIGAHVDSLARDLPALGAEVSVFTTASTAGRFSLGRPAARVTVAWPSPVVLRRMIRAADVVHAHGHQAGLLAVVAAVGTGVPVVVTWHNAVLGSGIRRRALELAERLQARRAALLTGASDDLVERARALGARDPRLTEVAAPAQPPAADEPPARGERAGSRLTSSPMVLVVSRVAPQKRLDVLVEAAGRLGRPEVRWVVAGDGDAELLARLQRRVAELGAPVEFIGARDDVPELMRHADVFALTSEWEARALVVQEAMAAGLPVVATDVGGLPGLLAGTGVLVPPGDPDALAAAVGDLLDDPGRRAELAAAAHARYAQLPTEADVVAAWLRCYEQLTRSEQDTPS